MTKKIYPGKDIQQLPHKYFCPTFKSKTLNFDELEKIRVNSFSTMINSNNTESIFYLLVIHNIEKDLLKKKLAVIYKRAKSIKKKKDNKTLKSV